MTCYDVSVWREPDGDWSARALHVDGAFTAGRSLAEVERNIKESIAVSLDLPRRMEETMELRLEVSVPGEGIDDLVLQATAARQAAKTSTAKASEVTAAAASALRSNGLSLRDIAIVLGISFQRAQQLVGKPAA